MFWKTNKDPKVSTSKALVRQDPRTNVRTATAQSNTSKTSVRNSTIFDEDTAKVTYRTTTQTVTHQQKATVTEITSRHTATDKELEEMMKTLQMDSGSTSSKFTKNNFSASSKSGPTTTIPLFKTEQTSVTCNDGRRVTSHTQEQRIDPIKLSSPKNTVFVDQTFRNPTANPIYKSITTTKTTIVPPTQKATATIQPYVSPYASRAIASTSTSSSSLRLPATSSMAVFPYGANKSDNKYGTAFSREFGSTSPTVRTTNTDARCYAPSTHTPKISTALPSSYSNYNNNTNKSFISGSTGNSNKTKKLKPGRAYIFNNKNFGKLATDSRVGTDEDVKELSNTFSIYGLRTVLITDPTKADIKSKVKKIATEDFTENSCLVIVLLSHGHRNDIMQAKDALYNINDDVLFPLLRNRTLIDKPKIFFIQACKGEFEKNDIFTDSMAQIIHDANEVLKCYSCFEGFVSYRTPRGSPFITNLCKSLREFGNEKHIEDILRTVRENVKKETQDKQIPSITSSLTKDFIFGQYTK